MTRREGPLGYFVHHQGRGHAERAASLVNNLAASRAVQLFCARDDIFPPLDPRISLMVIPSLFERDAAGPPALEAADTPDTLHCAPVGWASITQAVGIIAQWFATALPALFVTDVSAELAQLARIASVPHMAVLQHGTRDDPGHIAAYRGAMGLLAPYAAILEQPERPAWMTAKTIYAPGIGVDCTGIVPQADARRRLGIAQDVDLVVVLGGGGGTGLPTAPLTLGARTEPAATWVTLGKVASQWHETPPPNLMHLGWVDNPADWVSAADRIVSTCGNTTVHLAAAAGKPWVAIPEWRYFAEQSCKADALECARVAAVARDWPASAAAWHSMWQQAAVLDPQAQRALVVPDAAERAAAAIEACIGRIWAMEQGGAALTQADAA